MKCSSPLHNKPNAHGRRYGESRQKFWTCKCGRVLCMSCERGKSGCSYTCDICAIQTHMFADLAR